MKEGKKDINLGGILKKALLKRGWTQQQLADYLGTNQTSVSEWLNNKKIKKWLELIRLSNELDIVSEIFPEYKKVNDMEHVDTKTREIQEFSKRIERLEEIYRKIEYIEKFSGKIKHLEQVTELLYNLHKC